MKVASTIITLLLLMTSAIGHAAQPYTIHERHLPMFERIFSHADLAMEIVSGNADTEFPVTESGISTPSDTFLESAKTFQVTLNDEDSGVASMEGITLVWELRPNDDGEQSHTIDLIIMQRIASGKQSSFKGTLKLSADNWMELARMDRSQGDNEEYAYILLRLRDLSPDETKEGREKEEEES